MVKKRHFRIWCKFQHEISTDSSAEKRSVHSTQTSTVPKSDLIRIPFFTLCGCGVLKAKVGYFNLTLGFSIINLNSDLVGTGSVLTRQCIPLVSYHLPELLFSCKFPIFLFQSLWVFILCNIYNFPRFSIRCSFWRYLHIFYFAWMHLGLISYTIITYSLCF